MVYWYIPKNACTSLKIFFAELMSLEYSGLVHDAPFEYTHDENSFPEYFHFGVVRNPFTRVISLWKNKVLKEPITNDAYENGIERTVLGKYSDRFNAGMNLYEFSSMLSTLPLLSDPHFCPQCLLLPKKNIYIVAFENLEQEMKKVLSMNGIKKELPWVNKSEYDNKTYFITPGSRNIISTLYRMDFANYNYNINA